MNLPTKLYVNLYTFYKAPKSYLKYFTYCNLKNKEPDVDMLAKIIRLSILIKEIRAIHTMKVEYAPQTKEVKLVYINNVVH